ncbi:MAG: CTP synthase [Cytophagales bacterium]|jgi:CTP synthase|nr:CTP synthase [Cytophagales bacterium]
MERFIFVLGGVMSSIGKGISAASIGTLLQARGFSIRLKKFDPYINIDPGTMSPYRHGEVYVMGDGGEADLDFGHYERFTDVESSRKDGITTGKIYSTVLTRERQGDYLGADIQVVPHITNQIKEFILERSKEVDFTICEVGGTVGDIEGLPYIEALRQLKLELATSKVIFIYLTYLPFIKTSEELKTKPTQHSVKTLQSLGIQPDILLCRTEYPISNDIQKKLSMFCNIKLDNVIEARDAENIYFIPKMYHQAGLDKQICEHFNLEKNSSLVEENIEKKWGRVENSIKSAKQKVRIAVIGKYVKHKDAYLSLRQAIGHAGFANGGHVEIEWVDPEKDFENILKTLTNVRGIIVPGGFGVKGTENKIKVIQYARENKIPFLGICLGMQLAIIESCRNIGNVADANSREFVKEGTMVVDFLQNWDTGEKIEKRNITDQMGGTMRLGNYNCNLAPGSLAFRIYQKEQIVERHRHRYEINFKNYKDLFDHCGIVFSGMSTDGKLPEVMEREDHPFFIATQFHPEFKSHPFNGHPLFDCFIQVIMNKF